MSERKAEAALWTNGMGHCVGRVGDTVVFTGFATHGPGNAAMNADEISDIFAALSPSPDWIRSAEEFRKVPKWEGVREVVHFTDNEDSYNTLRTWGECLQMLSSGTWLGVCLGPLWSPPPFEAKPDVPQWQRDAASEIAQTCDLYGNPGDVLGIITKHAAATDEER